MTLAYSQICSKGGRTDNQDSAGAAQSGGKACFVVCDGLGAYSGSGMASDLCVRTMCDGFIKRGEATAESICSLAEEAHERILEEKRNSLYADGACTTFAGVFTDGRRTVIAHIGDTRVYRFVAGKIKYCTPDHSVAQMDVESGKISRRDLRYHRDQNKLTRVLGGRRFAVPDIYTIDSPPCRSDAFLLCTDGFWQYVDEEDMERDLLAGGDESQLLRRMENRLLSCAPSGNDNYTALLVRTAETGGNIC